MTEETGSNNRYTWLGVGVFLLVDIPIHLSLCTGFLKEGSSSMCSHNGLSSQTALILATAIVLMALAILSERGKWFARGFVVALLFTTVLTLGRCTFVWADPLNDLWGTTANARLKHRLGNKNAAARAGWANAMTRRPPDFPRGTALAGEVRLCAFTVPGVDYAIAQTDTEVVTRCTNLAPSYAGFDTVGTPARYVTPRPASEQFGQPAEKGDPGWRWARDPKNRLRIEVTMDPVLDRPWPRITIDTAGVLSVIAARDAAPNEVSPADEFQMLAQCLAKVPQELERRGDARVRAMGYVFEWNLETMVKKICPRLAARVARDPYDENAKAIQLTVARRLPGDDALIPLANYSVRLTIVSESPFRFTLHADHRGARSYDMTADGELQ